MLPDLVKEILTKTLKQLLPEITYQCCQKPARKCIQKYSKAKKSQSNCQKRLNIARNNLSNYYYTTLTYHHENNDKDSEDDNEDDEDQWWQY